MGDDAAVVAGPDGWLLLACDLVVAGVHADLDLVGVDDLGWKAVAANVSDIAAMGGRPGHILVSVAGPPGADLDRLYAGISAAARRWDCPVVGGDLANAGVLVVSVAITGTTGPGWRPVLRSGARAGDALMVTGPLGASASGLAALRSALRSPPGEGPSDALGAALAQRHRRPQARVEEGCAAAAAGASAMIDVSDGLSVDLGHLADASGVGFELDTVPVADGATEADALGGGEDYELVIATPDPERLARQFEDGGLRPPVRIGTCTDDGGRRQLRGRLLAASGWEHGWA